MLALEIYKPMFGLHTLIQFWGVAYLPHPLPNHVPHFLGVPLLLHLTAHPYRLYSLI